ncbi:MAG: hypothetical protein GY839_04975, partial [candidate division Zixibacteria bacterium]|nr:hypothetical protein [candidate division Zixibacteria bacterium]
MNNLKVAWIGLLLLVLIADRNVSNGKDLLYATNNNRSGFLSSTICFTENVGQFASKTKFKAEIESMVCYFCPDEVVYIFPLRENELSDISNVPDRNPPDIYRTDVRLDPKLKPGCVKTRFIGANPDVRISGADKLAHICNYFLGNHPDRWYTNVANYAEIIYHEIYPGINLRYYGVDGSLKYDLVAQPGADISRIEIQYEGIVSIAIGQDGALSIDTKFGNLRENQPYVYQNTDGRRQTIKGGYVIRKPGVYGFAIEGHYDQTQPLIIDAELVYSSYLGGIGWEESNGIATGPDGSIYITGNTYSMDFPLESPYDSTLEFIEDADVFITRFAPDGGSLIYSTYL